MPKMILIRGLPGSGKSTLAKKIMDTEFENLPVSHWEADMFFETEEGYRFDPSKIRDAHAWCKFNVEASMHNGSNVIISNTFTQRWEMDAYLDLAYRYDYALETLTCTGNYDNIHGVPEATIEKMRNRWED